MKKEYLVFFVLLVAVAMVMGSTFAIVSALQTYKAQQTKQPAKPLATIEQANSETERTAAVSRVSRESRYISSNPPARDDSSSSKLTPFETREVKRMLNELGYTKETLSHSLKAFQEEHQLTNTGILDSVTLDSIINMLSLTKARSFY